MIVLDRSYLTDRLLDALEPDPSDLDEDRVWHVGDHEKPPKGGWQGAEGKSEFIPFFILTSTPSQTPTGDLGTTGRDVWFGYAITVIARTRRTAEKTSALAHEKLNEIEREKLDDGSTISRIQVMRYGGVDRISIEPPLYLITDQFTIYTTR